MTPASCDLWWRWRESNPRPRNSIRDLYKHSRPLPLTWGVAADRAAPRPSRWEPKLPLERPYRHRSAARRLFDARPPGHRRETGADVTASGQFVPGLD